MGSLLHQLFPNTFKILPSFDRCLTKFQPLINHGLLGKKKMAHNKEVDLAYNLDYKSQMSIQYYLDILLQFSSIFTPEDVHFILLLFSQKSLTASTLK